MSGCTLSSNSTLNWDGGIYYNAGTLTSTDLDSGISGTTVVTL